MKQAASSFRIVVRPEAVHDVVHNESPDDFCGFSSRFSGYSLSIELFYAYQYESVTRDEAEKGPKTSMEKVD